jgi:glutamine cyclotransferase
MYKYQIVNYYPHAPSAFTQGLIYYQGDLYESTGRPYNHQPSSLRRVALTTGETLESPCPIELDEYAEGITLWNDCIIQLTYTEKVGFVYDVRNFEQIDNFSFDTDSGEGWGITHDGKRLIISDGTNKLYFLDPETFRVLGNIQVRDRDRQIEHLNELEYINGEILANIYGIDYIARINPTTGDVNDWIDLTRLRGSVGTAEEWEKVNNNKIAVLNGIAYDERGKRIFVTGKLWPYLFEIELVNTQEVT